NDYEKNTGLVICETFRGRDITAVPGVICVNHGPFAFGKDPAQAVYHATVLEQCAKMASLTEAINPYVKPAQQAILDKHYLRKHGKNAYYGQKST
ncbi:MAG: class II aldolase/adducin family protein, partial [Sphaerochaetaceae bacterium]